MHEIYGFAARDLERFLFFSFFVFQPLLTRVARETLIACFQEGHRLRSDGKYTSDGLLLMRQLI